MRSREVVGGERWWDALSGCHALYCGIEIWETCLCVLCCYGCFLIYLSIVIHVASDLSGGICFLLYFYIWEICWVV